MEASINSTKVFVIKKKNYNDNKLLKPAERRKYSQGYIEKKQVISIIYDKTYIRKKVFILELKECKAAPIYDHSDRQSD